MSISIPELIETITSSGLLPESDISAVQDILSAHGRLPSAEDFCKELVRQSHLTKLQAAAVLKGKAKNLVFGEYVVLDRIGSGGMGQVFKARHKPTGKLVALKVLSAEAVKNRRLIERFKKEAKAIARLKHPNIVRAYEAGKINSIRYLVMELVEGENMLDRVKRKGPLSIDEAVSCMIQAARGLEYAHQKGIVHRDIKPSNLLRDRRSGRVKILDLGLARVDDPDEDEDAIRLTMPGQMLGTARFMAPEQIEDARGADIRSDVYSLGCTLYFMLRGKAPYSGETIAHTLMAHVTAPIPDLCSKRTDAPTWLGQVFEKMLAKKPANRFQTMGELVSTVEKHLGDDLTKHESSHHPAIAVPDDHAEPEDEFLRLIEGRGDEGSSLEQLYSEAESEPAAEEFGAIDPIDSAVGDVPDAVALTPDDENALNELDLDRPADPREPAAHKPSTSPTQLPAADDASDEIDLAAFAVPSPGRTSEPERAAPAAPATQSRPATSSARPISSESADAIAGIQDRMRSLREREKAATRRYQVMGAAALSGLLIIVAAMYFLTRR